jgi:hypothetical protein
MLLPTCSVIGAPATSNGLAPRLSFAGIVGAAIGSTLGKLVDGQQLLFLFALAMIAGLDGGTTNSNRARSRRSIGLFRHRRRLSDRAGLMLATGMPILNAIGPSLFSVGSFGLTTAGGVAGGYGGMRAAVSLVANRRSLTFVFAGIIFAPDRCAHGSGRSLGPRFRGDDLIAMAPKIAMIATQPIEAVPV